MSERINWFDRYVKNAPPRGRDQAASLLLLKAQFKSQLVRGDLSESMKIARKVEDTPLKMQMFAEVAKLAHKKGEATVSAEILIEVRKLSSSPGLKGPHARALFLLASETAYFSTSDALLLLQDAVRLVNELIEESSKTETGSAARRPTTVNDPLWFVDSAEMGKAFSTLGRWHFEEVLLAVEKLENPAVRAAASLAAIERSIKAGPSSPVKPATPAPKH